MFTLCFSCSSLEYDPRLYGLYLHDDQQLPQELSMWDYLDDSVPGYQDSIVLHMVHKPIVVSFEEEEQRLVRDNACFTVTLTLITHHHSLSDPLSPHTV